MKKHIKLFEEYIEQQNNGHPGFLQSKEEIHAWLKRYDNDYDDNMYTINKDDWSVDVNGDVDIANRELDYIRVKFNEVNGRFWCNGQSLKFTTLKGSPNIVKWDFHCGLNSLITLQYAPTYVGGDFHCGLNINLATLGHKSEVKGEFKYDELRGTVEERAQRYINYIQTLNNDERGGSLQWLHDVDREFHKSVVEYVVNNNIDLPGVDMDIASDATKHSDSGLF